MKKQNFWEETNCPASLTAAAAFWSRPPLPVPVPSRQFWKTAWNILNDSADTTTTNCLVVA
ncbi:hypothetical protein AALB19_16790 [Oscillospiraceae bacterium 50-58]